MMMQRALARFVCLLLLATPCVADTQTGVLIIDAAFGVFDASTPGELNFEPSKVVPHRLEQRYGWVIELKTKKRHVSVREEYVLPPPKTQAKAAPDVIQLKRRSQVSQRELVPFEGKIYGEWSVGPDEPPGHRHLLVFVENELAGDFEFDVK